LRGQEARAEVIARNVAIIQKAATKNWRAAAWWLERSCPELSEKGVEVNVNHNDSRTQVNLAKIANSPEVLEKTNELSRELNELYEEDKD